MGAEDWSWRIYQSLLSCKLMNCALELMSLCPNFKKLKKIMKDLYLVFIFTYNVSVV